MSARSGMVLATAVLASCAANPVGPDSATVSATGSVVVVQIDGVNTRGFVERVVRGYPRRVTVAAGQHRLLVADHLGDAVAGHLLEFTARPGGRYAIRSNVVGYRFDFSIEEQAGAAAADEPTPAPP